MVHLPSQDLFLTCLVHCRWVTECIPAPVWHPVIQHCFPPPFWYNFTFLSVTIWSSTIKSFLSDDFLFKIGFKGFWHVLRSFGLILLHYCTVHPFYKFFTLLNKILNVWTLFYTKFKTGKGQKLIFKSILDIHTLIPDCYKMTLLISCNGFVHGTFFLSKTAQTYTQMATRICHLFWLLSFTARTALNKGAFNWSSQKNSMSKWRFPY